MNIKDHCLNMAAYSRWAAERLYAVINQLPDEKYVAARKLAFGSIHGTLNHILLVERIWLHRCSEWLTSFYRRCCTTRRSMRTTASSGITDDSRRGCGRCEVCARIGQRRP